MIDIRMVGSTEPSVSYIMFSFSSAYTTALAAHVDHTIQPVSRDVVLL